MIKKLVCTLLIGTFIIAVTPIRASAEWKSDSNGCNQTNELWYYFGDDGVMKKGWIQYGGSWYYLQNNGAMATGNINIDGKLYEFDNNGKWIDGYSNNGITSTNVSNVGPSKDKLKVASNFSIFDDNGKTYFKVRDDIYLKGGWNIDGVVYVFDDNGVMQKGIYTTKDGFKYQLGNDGKFIKCITNDKARLMTANAVTTKSTSDNSKIKLDDGYMLDIIGVCSNDPTVKDKSDLGVQVRGKTLYCKPNQIIKLGNIKVSGIDGDYSLFPNLSIVAEHTDKDIIFPEIILSEQDGFLKNIGQEITTHKPGKTTVTIVINGTKTSFDVVVTE